MVRYLQLAKGVQAIGIGQSRILRILPKPLIRNPNFPERLSGLKVRGDLLLNNLHQISHFVQPVDMLINLPWISSYVSGHRPPMTLKKDLIRILSCYYESERETSVTFIVD